VVAATKTARSSDVRRRRRNLLLVGAAATSVPGRKRRACQYGKDRELPGSREKGRNGGSSVSATFTGGQTARWCSRQGGAELLSAQGGVVEVVWGSCGEELREGRGLGGI
jgi:hypothetical protein